MTLRITYGIDPGQTGAIAVFFDERLESFIDMPTMARPAGGNQINGVELAAAIREARARAPGAAEVAVMEQVHAMPKQGVSSVFRFGEGYGVVQGVLAALGIRLENVHSSRWKKYMGLTGKEKDVARTMAIQKFPHMAGALARKKDVGRADAALLGHWGHQTEAVGTAPKPPRRDLLDEQEAAEAPP
jgi:hypothetical protein